MDFMYRKCYFINQKDFISSDDDSLNVFFFFFLRRNYIFVIYSYFFFCICNHCHQCILALKFKSDVQYKQSKFTLFLLFFCESNNFRPDCHGRVCLPFLKVEMIALKVCVAEKKKAKFGYT